MGVSLSPFFCVFGTFRLGWGNMNLFKKQVSTIGLDIGTSMVKTVRMSRKGEEYILEAFGIEPLEEGAVQSGEIRNPSSVAQAVLTAVEKCNPSDKYVIIALPNFSILSEVMTMDLIPEKKMRESVLIEAERITPFDMSEMEVDYSVLEKDEESGSMRVLMVAAKQDIVLSYIDCLSEAGLHPAIIDVDLFALSNIFHLNYNADQYRSSILINIGTDSTVAAFLQNGSFHSSRDISVSGTDFRKQLEFLPDMNLDKMFAIMQGNVDPELDTDAVTDAINAAGRDFANAVGVAISYFQTFDNVDTIDYIVLTGGYARIPGLTNMLELRTGAEVTVLDPFKSVRLAEDLVTGQDFDALGSYLSVAMGLASRKY